MGNRNEQLAARRAAQVQGWDLHTDRPDIGLQVYTSPAGAGGLLAKCFLGKAGKPTWFYRFADEGHLAAVVERTVDSRASHLSVKAERKAEAAAPIAVAVGDVFRCSWGYDQTNIDYYQVTRVVGPKTIEIRKIGAISWGEGHYMQGRCVPNPDDFIGPPRIKRIKNAGDGRPSIRIASYANAYRIDPVVDGVPAYPSSHWTAYA